MAPDCGRRLCVGGDSAGVRVGGVGSRAETTLRHHEAGAVLLPGGELGWGWEWVCFPAVCIAALSPPPPSSLISLPWFPCFSTCTCACSGVFCCCPQMTSYVLVGVVRTSRASGILLSVIRLQPLSQSDAAGFCVTDSLTPTTKLGLVTSLQLSVAVAMVMVYTAVTLCTCCWRLRRRRGRFGPRHADGVRDCSARGSSSVGVPRGPSPFLAARGSLEDPWWSLSHACVAKFWKCRYR